MGIIIFDARSMPCLTPWMMTKWVMRRIANVHTIFNIVTTILLLPVGGVLGKIAVKLLPDGKEEEGEERRLTFLTPIDYRRGHLVGQLSVSVSGLARP